MATIPTTSPQVAPPPVWMRTNHPLEFGDRLTRAEFERRWELMPELKRAELIDGVVYTNAAVYWDHGEHHAALVTWLTSYSALTPGVRCGCEASIRFDDENMPQPDATLRLDSQHGGRSTVGEKGMLEGSPELVAEAASSSVSYDLHQKLDVYRRFGVQEYIVLRIRDQALDWLELIQDQYVRREPDADGIHRSKILPGLWLDAKALHAGEMPKVLNVLRQGLASAEHQAFCQQLAGAQT